MGRRLGIGLLLAALIAGCRGTSTVPAENAVQSPSFLAVPREESSTGPRRDLFPPTPGNVHLNLVFNYAVHDLKREIGQVDLVWGASSPYPPQVFNEFYTPFEREGSYAQSNHSLHWWKTHHPDWIEYRCDRTSIAWEFGDRHDMPLDIANPAFMQFQRTGAVVSALNAGYNGIAFDNLSLGNYASRCGHFTLHARWIAQYSGNFSDPAYASDVTAWAKSTYAYVHGFSLRATMAMNYSYQSGSTFGQNLALMTQADEVLDERGFTNWGDKSRHVSTPQEWQRITRAIRTLQAHQTCYVENGEEPQRSRNITEAERLWVVANYLLTRDECTYVWMSGFSTKGAQQYGRLIIYPEYHLQVGKPIEPAIPEGLGWKRAYASGLVLVNPSDRSVDFRFRGTLYDENGHAYYGALTLNAQSGQILRATPPSPAPNADRQAEAPCRPTPPRVAPIGDC